MPYPTGAQGELEKCPISHANSNFVYPFFHFMSILFNVLKIAINRIPVNIGNYSVPC